MTFTDKFFSASLSPDAQKFLHNLFIGAKEEDFSSYKEDDLADFAIKTAAFFSNKRAGRAQVQAFSLKNTGESSGEVTVLSILNDDMPFLVDSIVNFLTEQGYVLYLVLHPIVYARRDGQGQLTELLTSAESLQEGVVRESFIQVYLKAILDPEKLKTCLEGIEIVLRDVRVSVLDWQSMQARLRHAILAYRNDPPPVPVEELTESIAFLEWLLGNHFTFLGVREYAFEGGALAGELVPVPESGLGILRRSTLDVLKIGDQAVTMTPEIRTFLMQPAPLIITKADVKSTVHRRVEMDYVGVKQFNQSGDLVGELQIVGLFTSTTYTRSPRDIPLVRRKIESVIAGCQLSMSSHSGKGLLNVLENFPRDELFQMDVPTLSQMSFDIMRLSERPRTRLFVRKDKFDRFVSAYVFIPKDRFNADIPAKISACLEAAFGGIVERFEPSFGEGAMARVHYIISRGGIAERDPIVEDVERLVCDLVKTFDDRVVEIAARSLPRSHSQRIEEMFRGAFPPGYCDAVSPQDAFESMQHISTLNGETIAVALGYNEETSFLSLKLYSIGASIPLSERLPIIENMGFKAIEETTFTIFPKIPETKFSNEKDGRCSVFIHDVILQCPEVFSFELSKHKKSLESCFLAVWNGQAENDTYNMLVLKAGLSWPQVALLRACGRYLKQVGIPFSDYYVAQTLVTNWQIAQRLIALFEKRFDPALPHSSKERQEEQESIQQEIEKALKDVTSLDEDRILRRFLSLLLVMVRTNFFQKSTFTVPILSFKLASHMLEELPEPKPFAEIFIYSPELEGVHLRSGPIARGGLRWSDRPEDFRTEVLGLVKAQMVKNAVIVPVGAKGGFVPKKLSLCGTREEVFSEGTRVYKLFILSLLALTDNITEAGVVPPLDTVCHDGEDPYLVVAADKGTATFSDTANTLASEHHFWLDDAFASGGSAGYDHKKMAITARGAWEAVKRHFREQGLDIQATPFRVVGVGDMSGDVFGNGMLLSEKIRLVAAFDHRDIFIDPDPDCALSFKERQRLFELPRSSWRDYSPDMISAGGGVFSRLQKSIPLTPEIKNLLNLQKDTVTPSEMIRAILTLEVDLLWLGGIGTYVKARTETNVEVGDKANDAIRISADELRVSVVGEGANLGVTQRGRIEFALRGGRINTDAVDNSAGVNSSDVEVNIKIATRTAEMSGKLDRSNRNQLLVEMTPDVAKAVLENNIKQTLCLTLAQARGVEDFSFNSNLISFLEEQGGLNRALEYLPDEHALSEREASQQVFTRPELAVLMAYTKLFLFHKIVLSSLPDQPYFESILLRYFPPLLVEKHPEEIKGHKLRREIIATSLANDMVNYTGPSFIPRLMRETDLEIEPITKAYALADHVFNSAALNASVEALNNKVTSEIQIEMFLETQTLLRRTTIWFLRNHGEDTPLDVLGSRYSEGVKALQRVLQDVLPPTALQRVAERRASLLEAGVFAEQAEQWSTFRYLQRSPDIIYVSSLLEMPVVDVARLFFKIGSDLAIDRLVTQGMQLPARDFYERMAVNRIVDGVLQTHRAIVIKALEEKQGVEDWFSSNQGKISRVRAQSDRLLGLKDFGLPHLVLAFRELTDLSR